MQLAMLGSIFYVLSLAGGQVYKICPLLQQQSLIRTPVHPGQETYLSVALMNYHIFIRGFLLVLGVSGFLLTMGALHTPQHSSALPLSFAS